MYVHAITDFICCAGLMFFIVRFRRNQVINRKDIELRNITAPERPKTLTCWFRWDGYHVGGDARRLNPRCFGLGGLGGRGVQDRTPRGMAYVTV